MRKTDLTLRELTNWKNYPAYRAIDATYTTHIGIKFIRLNYYYKFLTLIIQMKLMNPTERMSLRCMCSLPWTQPPGVSM
jgi:hypothetical protein